jgi:hypothetical protein
VRPHLQTTKQNYNSINTDCIYKAQRSCQTFA